MSTATAVRNSDTKVGGVGLFEGLEDLRDSLDAEDDGQDQQRPNGSDAGWDSAWRSVHEGLLADVKDSALQTKFSQLADELEEGAGVMSATRRAMRLPAFNEILSLGDAAVPEVIARLRTTDNRPLWLRVLGTLTPFPPGAGEETIDDAADAWIQWWNLTHWGPSN